MTVAGVTGVILAGGRGARFGGQDKGWVDYRGRPLIEQVLARFAPQVEAVMISANRNLAAYRALGLPVVSDSPEFGAFAGPLIGILAALRALRGGWLAVVPCDAPALPTDLVRRLRMPQRAAVAVADGRLQPLFCLLPATCASDLVDYLSEGKRRADAWLQRIAAVPVAFEDAAAFANVNTPQDLAA
ncbi:MAG: molybdenum cofactor guanylyltransferase MobA [Sutterellaceae bacterium]|nr:molybdenum cofactor guanylyltransferase [Burkholderiaceae bacterium]MDW8429834.1 molybdenum cofactor guanylyltransferase MobA [Sutterellaceae bacterium]